MKVIDAHVGPLKDPHDAVMFLIREGIVDPAEVGADADAAADTDVDT